MNFKNRNLWILVIVIVAVFCCCALLAIAAGTTLLRRGDVFDGGLFTPNTFDLGDMQGERIDQRFSLGQSPSLDLDTFSGSIDVRGEDTDEIHVIAVKQARSADRLSEIQVNMTERGGGLVIESEKPRGLNNASVNFEITVPVGTRLDLRTGSGSVNVSSISGVIDVHSAAGSLDFSNIAGPVKAHTNAGSIFLNGINGVTDARTFSGGIEMRDSTGNVQLDTFSGGIVYEGDPEGDCKFSSKSGGIRLTLPADLNMKVDLRAISGTVDVGYLTLSGDINKRSVKGIIGSDGHGGKITASTPTGDIAIIPR